MNQDKYIELRKTSTIVENRGDFKVSNAESNPELFRDLLNRILNSNLPQKIWEPFAGHNGRSKTQDIVSGTDVQLFSFDLSPVDARVIRADSTVFYPNTIMGGAFFHPPYFGATPQSESPRDISKVDDWDEYLCALTRTIRLIKKTTIKNGLVYAVGRDYRIHGERIRLDLEYINIFCNNMFVLESVLMSEPDVCLVFKNI